MKVLPRLPRLNPRRPKPNIKERGEGGERDLPTGKLEAGVVCGSGADRTMQLKTALQCQAELERVYRSAHITKCYRLNRFSVWLAGHKQLEGPSCWERN